MVGRKGANALISLSRCIGPLCCTVVGFLFAGSASAQEPADQERLSRWELFVQGGAYFSNRIGGSVPRLLIQVREDIRYDRTGRLFTGLRFALTSRDQIEASYSYSVGRATNTVTGLRPGGTSVFKAEFTVQYLSFNYLRQLRRQGRIRPFRHSRNRTGDF